MARKRLIMAPGPTNIPDEYMEELALEFPHHRTQEFAVLLADLENNLKKIIKLANGEVVIFTSSGSGAMESTVANFFATGDTVLVIDIGFFGQRYKAMCETFGLNVIHLPYPPGETYQLEDVKAALAAHPEIKAVYVTHHETSTGVLNDLQALGELIKPLDDTLLITDSISGLVIHPFDMDAWGVDAVAGGSQKGFLVPPGLSFVGLSQKALSKIARASTPRFYWDYQQMLELAKKGQTPSTPAINLMKAMLRSSNDLLEQGLESVWQHHYQLRKYLESKMLAMGYTLGVSDEAIRGNVIVPMNLQPGMDSLEICRELESEHGIITIYGLGEKMHSMLRIGVIGPLCEADIEQFCDALAAVTKKLYNY